ncbi:IclR family transcriptional regulator [Paenibacillus mendelii]|uniref:IclR family transcriptional regulator n=1 Tax=Paenibacillus mendelii TaxID=206163 RepID=A0ABV6J289_9BACL|nr:IclR family transcriptional regulator [Paenibacillus mendelii]MCQ6560524.1 IclR family transcriptional regulator [Paenibacillus mendelii]
MKEEQEKQDRYTIYSIEKALELIELLSERESASLIELVDLLKQPKSSLYRIILTLEKRGYVERSDSDGKYCLGYKNLIITRNLLEKNNLRGSAIPEMNRLMERYGDTVNLGVLSNGEVLYLEIIEGTFALRMTDRVGSKAPLHATAMGKAITAFMEEPERNRLVSEMSLQKITDYTIVDKGKLLEQLETIRQAGYAVDDQEVVEGARCIAVPIFDMFGKAVGAISLSGALHRFPKERLQEIAEEMKRSAGLISLKLGHVQA